MTKKKAIILTTRHPFPAKGGDKLRLYNHLKYYKENNYFVDLVIIGFEKKIPQNEYYNFNNIYYFKPSLLIFFLKLITNKKISLQILLYFQNFIKKKIKSKFSNTNYDEALFHLIRTAKYHTQINSKIKKFEMTDAISLAYSRALKVKQIPKLLKILYNYEKIRLYKEERNIIKFFDYVYLISHFDRKFITFGLKVSNKIIVDLNKIKNIFLRNAYHNKSKDLLFIGNFKSISNKIASIELIKLITKFNKNYNQNLRIIFCGNAGIIEKKFFKLNKISDWISWDQLNSGNKTFAMGICNNKIVSGFQNKITDYLKLELPCLVYYKSYYSMSKTDQSKVIKYFDEKDFYSKLSEFLRNKNNVI